MTDKLTPQEISDLTKVMLRPVKGVPFDLVVRGICNTQVIHFDPQDPLHRQTAEAIHQAALRAGQAIQKAPLDSDRPNEAGNKLELILLEALKSLGVNATRPKTKSGKKKSSGYPDLEIVVKGLHAYIECKTYDEGNEDTTFRSFYFSPSEDHKICQDALHFVVGFELGQKKKGSFIAKAFKVLSLDALEVNVKYEFNTNNQKLYSGTNGASLLHDEKL